MRFGENPSRVELYRGLSTVRFFGGGLQSKDVRLLSGGRVVAKSFNASDEKQINLFRREVKNYEAAQGCSFVPTILAIDRTDRVIYMTYCGESPKEYTPELKKLVQEMLGKLRQKYKLTRNFFRRLDGLPDLSNLAVDENGSVSIIDLGAPWTTVKPTINPPVPSVSFALFKPRKKPTNKRTNKPQFTLA